MSGLRRTLARGALHSMGPPSRQGGGATRAPRRAEGAFVSGQKTREGTPLPDEEFSLEPEGSSPPKVVGMTMRLSEEVKAALLSAQKDGVAVQLKFGAQNHVLKIGDREYPFTSSDEDRKTYEAYVERRDADQSSGRLVEVGPIVKKLNLQRSLTAAEANKLKQRSVAAEKQLKSRKAIVLEHSSTLDVKQAASTAKKAVSHTRKLVAKDSLNPVARKVKISETVSPAGTPSRGQQPVRSRSNSPADGPLPTPHNPGPSRLAVSSPPTETPATALSPVPSTGPLERPVSRESVPPEEGPQGKVQKAPPQKSPPKRGATNQEVKAAIVAALAGAPEHKMKTKSLEKSVQDALPDDVAFTKQQFDRLLSSVARFKAPGFYFLTPEALKAFSEGRIMNSTSPETIASDSSALNIESPPLAAPPQSETEAAGPAKAETKATDTKATDKPVVGSANEEAAKAGSANKEGAKPGDSREARDVREGVDGAEGVPEEGGSEKGIVEGGGKEEEGQRSPEKEAETKEEDERGGQSSSSDSESGSESDSDSSSGSSGSSSSEEEGEEEGGKGEEVQSPPEKRTAEKASEEDVGVGVEPERIEDGELKTDEKVGSRKEAEGEEKMVGADKGKTEVEKEGEAGGKKQSKGPESIAREAGLKPAVEVERIDDGPPDAVATEVVGTPKAEVHRAEAESGRKRKESEGTEGVAKKRKTEMGGSKEGEATELRARNSSKPVQKDNKLSKGGVAEKQSVPEAAKQKTAKVTPKQGAKDGSGAKAAGSDAKPAGSDAKKRDVPREAGRSSGVNGQDEGVNERRASHASAGPSVTDDIRNSSALSKYKAASDRLAEQKASRKAIAIELTDQTALDKRKESKDASKRPPSGPSGGGSKLVKGLVKKIGSLGSKAGGLGGGKAGLEKGQGSKPLARTQIERLDDGPRAGVLTPKSGEKRRHEEDSTESVKKAKKDGVPAAKELGMGAKEGKRGFTPRKDEFGSSPLEEGELAPAAKKSKVSHSNVVDRGEKLDGKKADAKKDGKKAGSEKGIKPTSGKTVKQVSESEGKARVENGGKPKSEGPKGSMGGGKLGTNQGSKPGVVKKLPPKTNGKPSEGTGAKGPKKAGEDRVATTTGAPKQVPSGKLAQNGGQKKGPSEPPGKASQPAAANGKGLHSTNGKAGAQDGKPQRPEVKNGANGTKEVTEQDWLKYADVEPASERRMIGSKEEYDAALDEFATKWPVYDYLVRVLEEQRVQFLAYDDQMAAARKTHNEQQLRELELMLRVEYNKVKKVHKRMRSAFVTLHKDLAVLKPVLKAFALKHGLQNGEHKGGA